MKTTPRRSSAREQKSTWWRECCPSFWPKAKKPVPSGIPTVSDAINSLPIPQKEPNQVDVLGHREEPSSSPAYEPLQVDAGRVPTFKKEPNQGDPSSAQIQKQVDVHGQGEEPSSSPAYEPHQLDAARVPTFKKESPSGNFCTYEDESITLNATFEDGLNNWAARGCRIDFHESMGNGDVLPYNGKFFARATHRTDSWHGIQQEITARVQRELAYEVRAVVCIYKHSSPVNVQVTLWVQTPDQHEQYICIANMVASEKEWFQLQGKFLLNGDVSRVIIFLEGPPAGVDILVNCLMVKRAEKTPSFYHHRVFEESTSGKFYADGDENIILNANFADGINNWAARGCLIDFHESMGNGKVLPYNGKFFASATQRTESWNGIQQEITSRVQRKLAYEVRAVVRICGNSSPANVQATLWVQTEGHHEQYISIANSLASDKEWVQLQGKFLVNGSTRRVIIFLEGPPAGVDILVNCLTVKRKSHFTTSSS